uniref:Kinesin 5b protein n=1 Tax=Marsilea vestita TaxID=59764 RepID=A0A142KW95_MARVE|nr:kinesin 5b protein [Marsilea vestita]
MPPSPSPLYPASPAAPLPSKERDKGVNVQVVVRCRPFNDDELRLNGPHVVMCNEARREVTVTTKLLDRMFTFDKVFGQQAQQKDLYDQAIAPIVNEVLEGYNCTVFAYGQTGTGKTYTMEGPARKSKNAGELPTEAGVIPRAVQQIFHTLESQHAEYNMKVTFLELYNEEITDLLAPDEISRLVDDKPRKPLALMEDGKGGVLVRGLEEEVVYSANDIFNLLERGSAKRRTAETLLNKQSSRSHSIFSIIIHIKESNIGGEELIKCGRLNLVDLAGSESISRSGAREARAREAGEINKSLLTLGRVITSLVEHLGHVPYRDSKLTRLLRESLGGKAKTCIIATIGPSFQCLEESLSTLDYAYRAKSIKNKPEMNQKILKSALIKDLYMEIEKLKTEVFAARERNGIYLPRDRYLQEEAGKKAMSDKIDQMESEIHAKDKQLEEMEASLESERQLSAYLSSGLEATKNKLEETEDCLCDAQEKIKEAQYIIKERDYVISRLQQSENELVQKAANLRAELESSVEDIAGLHLKIDRKSDIEEQNHKLVQSFQSSLGEHLESLRRTVANSIAQQQQKFQDTEQQLRSFITTKEKVSEDLKEKVSSLKDIYCSGLKGLNGMVECHDKESASTFEKLNGAISGHASALEELLSVAVSEAELVCKDLQTTLQNQEREIIGFTKQLQQGAMQNIESLRTISNVTIEFFLSLEKGATELCQALYQSHKTQQECLEKLEETYQECSKREEEELIQKIADMLTASSDRKLDLVHTKLKHLRETGSKDFQEMEHGMLDMHGISSKARIKWQSYMGQAENTYAEHSASLSAKNSQLQGLIQDCVKGTKAAGDKWKSGQRTLHELEAKNVQQVESIIKDGIHTNELLLKKFNESNESIVSSIDTGYAHILDSIESSLTNDKDAGTATLSSCSRQSTALTELQTSHHSGTKSIEDLADRCFNEEYTEDTPTCSTPKKRNIEVPCQASIDGLRAPEFEKMLVEFHEANAPLLMGEKANSNRSPIRETKIPIFADSSLLKDGRLPLITLN